MRTIYHTYNETLDIGRVKGQAIVIIKCLNQLWHTWSWSKKWVWVLKPNLSLPMTQNQVAVTVLDTVGRIRLLWHVCMGPNILNLGVVSCDLKPILTLPHSWLKSQWRLCIGRWSYFIKMINTSIAITCNSDALVVRWSSGVNWQCRRWDFRPGKLSH